MRRFANAFRKDGRRSPGDVNASTALLSLLVVLAANDVEARTWKILPDGSGDAATIQAAVDSSAMGDSVLVAGGRYHERVVLEPHRTFIGSWNLSFTSFDVATSPTTVDADSLGACMLAAFDGVVDSTGIVSDFRFVDGIGVLHAGMTRGGGLHARNLRQIRNCVAESSFADFGAGIFATGDRLTLDGVVARSNLAGFGGGGVQVISTQKATISGGDVSQNSIDIGALGTARGAGLWISGPRCLIDASSFAQNSAFVPIADGIEGLGVYSECDTTEILSCQFVENGEGSILDSAFSKPTPFEAPRAMDVSSSGGGLHMGFGWVRDSFFDANGFQMEGSSRGGGISMARGEVVRTILTRNSAHGGDGSGSGGAIFADSVLVSDCRIERNHAGGGTGGNGGGIRAQDLVLRRTILLENAATCSGSDCVQGGGVSAAHIDAMNATISRNHTGFHLAGNGIGIFADSGIVLNCILSENSAYESGYPHVGGILGPVSSSHNLFWNNAGVPYSGIVDSTAHLHENPLLANVAAGDVHLLLHSPGIDRGSAGWHDPDGSISDRGAYGGPGATMDQPSRVLGIFGFGTGFGNQLTWNASTAPDLAGYAIYRSSVPGVPPGLPTLLDLIPRGATSYTHRFAYPGTALHYRISAFDSTNYGGGFSDHFTLVAQPWHGGGRTDAAFQINGLSGGGQFGASVFTADLNDDALADLIVGSPGNGNGRVSIFWGEASFAPAVESDADVVILAPRPGEDFGWVLGAGDVSGDGVDDLLIGASRASPLGRSLAGAIYVIEGRTSWPNPPVMIDLASQPADKTLLGAAATERAGATLAVGDLNDDQLPDIAIGAPEHLTPANRRDGEVRILYSISTAPDSVDLASIPVPFTVVHSDTAGLQSGDRFGSAIAIGDLSGDGIDDLAVGSRAEDPGNVSAAGSVHVIAGDPVLISTPLIDLRVTPALLRIDGAGVSDELGSSLAIFDLQGDGGLELAAGAPGAERPGTSATVGAVYVLPLSSAPSSIQPLATKPAWMSIYGEAPGSFLGGAIAYGTHGSHDEAHIWLGARGTLSGRGSAHAIWGVRDLYPGVIALDQSREDWRIEGPPLGDVTILPSLGGSVAMGDFDGDGRLDLVAGVHGADSGSPIDVGAVAIVMNEDATDAPPPTVVVTAPQSLKIYHRGANPAVGRVAYAIDLPHSGPVDVEVFDITGRRVSRESLGLHAGVHVLEWPNGGGAERPSSGVYMFRVTTQQDHAELRSVLIR